MLRISRGFASQPRKRTISLRSSAIDLALYNLEDIVVSFLGMRDDAAGTVLDAVPERKGAVAVEQIERTPAEETGLPFFKVVAGIERAIAVGEKFVVHLYNSSLGNFPGGSG
jgi:hypothetical protein